LTRNKKDVILPLENVHAFTNKFEELRGTNENEFLTGYQANKAIAPLIVCQQCICEIHVFEIDPGAAVLPPVTCQLRTRENDHGIT
jgi:hypothetical protein